MWTIIGYGAPAALTLVSSILLARSLGPGGRGALQAIQLYPQLLTIAVTFGLIQSLNFFCARDDDRVGEYLGTTIVFTLALAVPCCIALAFALPSLLHEFEPQTRWAGLLFLFFVPCHQLIALPWSALFGQRHYREWNIVRMLPQILYGLVALASVTLGWKNAAGIALVYLATYAFIVGPATWIAYYRVIGQRLRFSFVALRPLLKYGGVALLGQAPNVFNLRMDQAFIASLLPPAQLGLYAVAVSWSSLQLIALNVVAANLLPRLPKAEGDQQRRYVATALRWGAMLSAAGTIAMLLCTRILFRALFGARFAEAMPMTYVLIVAGGILALNQVLGDASRGLGRPGYAAIADILGAVVTAVGLWAFLAKGGIMVAALVSLTSYLASFIVLMAVIFNLVPRLGSELRAGVSSDARMLRGMTMRFTARAG